jgi:hypothetical protein
MGTQKVNHKVLSGGYRVGSQTPIDDRLVFATTTDALTLSSSDPYRYYEGMRIWCLDVDKEYVWIESVSGLIAGGFTYPAGVVVTNSDASTVTYANRTFNFVETGVSALISINDWVALTAYDADVVLAAVSPTSGHQTIYRRVAAGTSAATFDVAEEALHFTLATVGNSAAKYSADLVFVAGVPLTIVHGITGLANGYEVTWSFVNSSDEVVEPGTIDSFTATGMDITFGTSGTYTVTIIG